MTSREENEQQVRGYFDRSHSYFSAVVEQLTDDVDAVMEEASAFFDDMIQDMAYVDSPDKAMADSLFASSVLLALYLPLKSRGVDVHEFGNRVIAKMSEPPRPSSKKRNAAPVQSMPDDFDKFIRQGKLSQESGATGEFVFDAFRGHGDDYKWGMNITSCAICHAFSKYDAMDLVPYMCATDDVVSDKGNHGLRRSGSIGVGARHCDFIYQDGAEAVHIAGLYPDKIRLAQQS